MAAAKITLQKLLSKSVRSRAARTAVELGRGRIRHLEGVRVGRDVKITGPGSLDLAAGARIREGARIWVGAGATLTVGNGSFIGIRAIVNVASAVTIGEGSEMSWDCQILDTDFHRVLDADGRLRPMTKPIVVGDGVLIGVRATILKGVTIGDGAIVAAAAVVTRDVDAGCVVAGNPARVIGRTAGWS